MIKASILLVFELFPAIQNISLQDHSSVDCDGTQIFLPHTQIIQYGKTWYERKLGAVLRDENVYTYIANFISFASEKPRWKPLWDFIKRKIHKEHEATYREAIHTIWVHTDTFRDMIVYMIKTKQCHLFVDWLDPYILDTSRLSIMNEYYIIKRHSDAHFTYASIQSNPYVQKLDTRAQTARMNVFSTYVPRNKHGGTRYTHGSISLYDMI